MTFPTPHIGHSRRGLFFTRPDYQSNNAKPSEKDHDLPGTFGVAVSIPNHYTIKVVLRFSDTPTPNHEKNYQNTKKICFLSGKELKIRMSTMQWNLQARPKILNN
jgi:hypothetical protein